MANPVPGARRLPALRRDEALLAFASTLLALGVAFLLRGLDRGGGALSGAILASSLITGFVAMAAFARTDYRQIRRFGILPAGLFLAGCIALAPLPPGVRRNVHLVIGDPETIVLLVVVLLLAVALNEESHRHTRRFFGAVLLAGIVVLGTALLPTEAAARSSLLAAAVGLSTAVAARLPRRPLLVLAALLIMPLFIAPHALRHAFSRASPWSPRYSLNAIADGGLTGSGLDFLLGPHFFSARRFLLAIVGERFGLIGITVALILLLTLFLVGLRIARTAPDRFGALLACGITAAIFLQGAASAAGSLALLPSGIPPPFAGGFGAVGMLAGIGIVLGVARQRPVPATVDVTNNPFRTERLVRVGATVIALLLLRGAAIVHGHRGSLRNMKQEVPALRGRVLFRNGAILAEQIPAISIAIRPKHMTSERIEAVLAGLSPLLGPERSAEARVRILKRRDQRFAWIARQIPGDPGTIAKSIPPSIRRDLVLVDDRARRYPHGALAAAVIGGCGRSDDLTGLEGLEFRFEQRLQGEGPGLCYVDARGREIPGQKCRPRGSDVQTTIDIGFQSSLEQFLRESLPSGGTAAGVVLDMVNGEVLALASLPSYDPADIGRAAPDLLRNRAVEHLYDLPAEMTHRLLLARALDAKVAQPSDLPLIAAVTVNPPWPEDWAVAALRSLGLDQRTGIELPGEARGRITSKPLAGERSAVKATIIGAAAALATLSSGRRVTPSIVVKREAARQEESDIPAYGADLVGMALFPEVAGEPGSGRVARVLSIRSPDERTWHAGFVSASSGCSPLTFLLLADSALVEEPSPAPLARFLSALSRGQ